jgi:hypothetical protein
MTYERLGRPPLDDRAVRYAGPRLRFRAPRRDLAHGYVACLGSTETCGSRIARPWPALSEAALGLPCLNLGLPNAGPDVIATDPGLLRMAGSARAVVLQLPGAINLSNRFYRVHPRRNDRFVEAAPALRALYPEVDFTEFHFTRHLVHRLAAISPARFARLRDGMQEAWVSRLAGLLRGLAPPVVLLWLAGRAPQGQPDDPDGPAIGAEPAFVTDAMLAALAPLAAATVRAEARGDPRPPVPQGMTATRPGHPAHRAVADALHPVLARVLQGRTPPGPHQDTLLLHGPNTPGESRRRRDGGSAP